MTARVMNIIGGLINIICALIFVFVAFYFAASSALTAGHILTAVICGVISFCLFVEAYNATVEAYNATLKNGRKFESKSSSKA